MKIGDLVGWEYAENDHSEHTKVAYGIVLRFSRTGQKTKSAEILFDTGEMVWIDCSHLEVVSAEV